MELETKKCYIDNILFFLEEDISEEEDVKANETGSSSQKRSRSEVLPRSNIISFFLFLLNLNKPT